MISNSLAHALKAVIYIAVNSSEEHRIRIQDLSEDIDAPKAYVAKLLQDLVRNGILRSAKGPHGGFYFKDADLDVNLIKIVEVIEGKTKYQTCLLTFKACDKKHPCPLHETIGTLRMSLLEKFRNITIRNLVEDIEQKKSFIK